MILYVIFLVLLALSAIIALWLAFYALQRRTVPGALPFTLILLGAFVWAGGYFVELIAPSLEAKIFWDNVQFLGTDALATGSVLFALAYTGRLARMRRFIWLFALFPALSALIVWTDAYHNLVRIAPRLDTAGVFPVLAYELGPWVWVVAAYSYLLLLAALGMLVAHMAHSDRRSWPQIGAIILGLSAPAIGGLMTIFGFVPIAGMEHLDVAPITLAIANPIFAWGVFRQHLLAAQEHLHTQEELFRLTFDQSPLGAAIVGLDYRFLRVNAALCQMIGYAAEELLGLDFQAITYPDDLEASLVPARRLADGELEHYAIEKRYIRKDGRIIWVNLLVQKVQSRNGRPLHFLGLVEDITERKQAEAAVRQARDELATLLDIAQQLVSTLDLESLLHQILEHLASLVSYNGAAILTRAGDTLELQAYRGLPSSYHSPGARFAASHIPAVHRMLATRQAFCLDDMQADTTLTTTIAAMSGQPQRMRAWMGVPLIVKDEIIGMLSLFHTQPGYYTQQHLERAQAFAYSVAIALDNAQLYRQAQAVATIEERTRIARDLHDAVTQTLFSASLIAEALPAAWKQSSEKGQRGLEELRQLTRSALAEMRTLLLELRPAALTEKPLGEIVRQLSTALMGRAKLPISLTVEGDCVLPPDVQVAFYRIAQEALNNIIKHAEAHQVTIALQCQPDQVQIQIQDDGRGFAPDGIGPGCLGLSIMRERVAQIGARLQINSHPGQGTRVTVLWARSGLQEYIGATYALEKNLI